MLLAEKELSRRHLCAFHCGRSGLTACYDGTCFLKIWKFVDIFKKMEFCRYFQEEEFCELQGIRRRPMYRAFVLDCAAPNALLQDSGDGTTLRGRAELRH
jgi:hypothetical protein